MGKQSTTNDDDDDDDNNNNNNTNDIFGSYRECGYKDMTIELVRIRCLRMAAVAVVVPDGRCKCGTTAGGRRQRGGDRHIGPRSLASHTTAAYHYKSGLANIFFSRHALDRI